MTRAFNTIHDVVGNITMASTVLSVADGAMADIKKSLMKIRSLAVKANSEDVSVSNNWYLNVEKDALVLEIMRVTEYTKINDMVLLDGSFVAQKFQAGFAQGDEIWISFFQSMRPKELGIHEIDLNCSRGCIQDTLVKVDMAIDIVNKSIAIIMALQYRIENAKSMLEKIVFNTCVDQCVVQGFDSLVRSQQDEEGAINYFV